MSAIVIAGFPGIGKSHLFREGFNASDSDSSLFSWVTVDGKKERNPEFPANYIKHILREIETRDFVLVSTHRDVRNALDANKICYALVYPGLECRDEYLKRYIDRESPKAFVDMMAEKFADFVKECDDHESVFACHFELEPKEFLSDVLEDIQAVMPEFVEELDTRKHVGAATQQHLCAMLQNQSQVTAPEFVD